jgi:hypothetical protein
MALDKGLLGSTNDRFVLEQSGDWEWDTGGYPEYPSISSRNGHYRPSEKHAEIWPVVRWYSEGRGTARVGMTKYEVGLTYVFTTIYSLFGLGIIISYGYNAGLMKGVCLDQAHEGQSSPHDLRESQP